MSQLVAHFEVELPGHCLIATPRVRQIPLTCTIEGFDVNVQIDGRSLRSLGQAAGDQYWTYALGKLLVKVARDEDEVPPPAMLDAEGQLNYKIQEEYFSRRIKAYALVACEAINRIIRFFKFELKTPFLQEFSADHQTFRNAEWTDASDTLIGKGAYEVVIGPTPGFNGELGIQKVEDESAELLRVELTNPRKWTLHKQILSDAQTALYECNLRRAVLELAIVSELVVERKFLSGDSPAIEAFEYLEDHARYRVGVPEYLDGVAKRAFGKSFKQDRSEDYRNIENLFRARNKVAHMGELWYRDNSPDRIDVDYDLVARWWDSVLRLINWLGQLRRIK